MFFLHIGMGNFEGWWMQIQKRGNLASCVGEMCAVEVILSGIFHIVRLFLKKGGKTRNPQFNQKNGPET